MSAGEGSGEEGHDSILDNLVGRVLLLCFRAVLGANVVEINNAMALVRHGDIPVVEVQMFLFAFWLVSVVAAAIVMNNDVTNAVDVLEKDSAKVIVDRNQHGCRIVNCEVMGVKIKWERSCQAAWTMNMIILLRMMVLVVVAGKQKASRQGNRRGAVIIIGSLGTSARQ